ncbi:MAG: hydroxyacid dehydrogenase [Bacillota bacterium]|nr:hydroxyacid dehydrogenase [Bacillota bacterium]
MTVKPRACFLTAAGEAGIRAAYSDESRARLAAAFALDAPFYTSLEDIPGYDAVALFSTWGMPAPDAATLTRRLPRLEAVFYAAGSVQSFACPFLERGIRVYSAARANAVPVAEYTVAAILLSNKGFWQSARHNLAGRRGEAVRLSRAQPGNYAARIGIIGAGAVGRLVIEKLTALDAELEIWVFDPFLPAAEARRLGVRLVDGLPELFASCQVISNHLANNAETRGMLDAACFGRMSPTATFINTGRGAQVVEADLVAALREEPGRFAILDVTWPEPSDPEGPLHKLDNIILTPHIAGSQANEIWRMGALMTRAAEDWCAGRPSPYEVSLEMLRTMA